VKESNLRLRGKSPELNHSANGAWRRVEESNPRVSPRPGVQDQLPTTGRHPPLSGWPDSNRRPPRPERGALTCLRYNPLVGTAGLEPTASGPPDQRANQLRHVPMRTPGADRTRDLLVRSQALYPLSYGGMVSPEGLEPSTSALSGPRSDQMSYDDMAERPGFEPGPVAWNALAGHRNRPLCHLSMCADEGTRTPDRPADNRVL
jgi:hypothetical protein